MALPESCVRGSSRTPLFPGLSFFSRPGKYGRRPVARRRPMQPDRPPLPPGAGHGSHPSTTGHPDRIPSGEGPRNTRTDTPNPLVTYTFLPEPDRRTGHRCVLRDPPSGPDPPAPHRPPRHRQAHAPPPPDRQLLRSTVAPTDRPCPYTTLFHHMAGYPPAPIGRSGPPARPKSKNADT